MLLHSYYSLTVYGNCSLSFHVVLNSQNTSLSIFFNIPMHLSSVGLFTIMENVLYHAQLIFYVISYLFVHITGTFLCDNMSEREEQQLTTKTVSLWSHINRPEVIHTFMNPVYEPNSKVIWPSVAPVSLVSNLKYHNI